uniref:Myb/SANT-like DNA-binding domain-containing protein n=1 Tax=Daphnia galeata TaxID=27404 RepID=A0A8J2RFQ6_9CRUS|nr:unnamed protein product [Daphnia galeata]
MANLYTQEQNLNYIIFDVEYCGRLFRVPITSKKYETRIKQDATLRLEFVKKVQAKIAENDPKFLSCETILVLILMCISVREGEATKLKLVPSTSGSNRVLTPMPKVAQANNHVNKKKSQTNSGAAAVAGTAGAGVHRWTFDEVSTLLEFYAIYEHRFSKKIKRTATLWEKVNKEMEKKGVKTTAERCSVKFAAIKKRFNELNDQNLDEDDQAQAHDQSQAQDQAQALDQAQAQAAPSRNVEELASQCANCKATVSHSAYATVGQCSRCKVVIQLTTPVERTNTLEEDTESYEETRRNYLHTRFPQFISIFDIRHRNIPNRFPQDDTFEDQLEYFHQQPRNNGGIQEEDFNLQQEHEQEQELNLQEEDNEEQKNPVEEEQEETQYNKRRGSDDLQD